MVIVGHVTSIGQNVPLLGFKPETITALYPALLATPRDEPM